MKAYGWLVILAGLLLVPSCEAPPSDARVSEEPRSVERREATATGSVPRISVEDLVFLLEKPEGSSVIVIDVRSRESYQRRRIPGAVSIPLADLGNRVPEIDRDASIVTYCT